MEIQGLTLASGRTRNNFSITADEVREKREATAQQGVITNESEQESSANSIQPEELLKNIKALTEEGVYSVRFEVDDTTHDLIIKQIDQESGEVIRQIPSEEILGSRKHLSELRGNIVETES